MSDRKFQPEPDDELLSAYLDDELSPEDRAAVEARLASDPEAQQLLHQLRSVSQSVQRLPLESVGRDLTNTILARVSENRRDATHRRVEPLDAAPAISILRTRRSWIWASLTIAAGLLIMVLQRGDQDDKKKLAAVRQRVGDVAEGRRDVKDLKTPASDRPAVAPSRATERLADQSAVVAEDKSKLALGAPVAPASPEQPEISAAPGSPAAAAAKPANEALVRNDPLMPRLTPGAPAAAPPSPATDAGSLDMLNTNGAAGRVSEPAGATAAKQSSADNNFAADRAAARGKAEASAAGGAYGQMNASLESSASPGDTVARTVAPGDAVGNPSGVSGSAASRGPAIGGATLGGEQTLPFAGGSLRADEGIAQGRAAEAQLLARSAEPQLVVEIVATPAAVEAGLFDKLLEKNGIKLESAAVSEGKESFTAGDLAKQSARSDQPLNAAAQTPASEPDLVVVEAPRATIEKCLVELQRDAENFAALDVQLPRDIANRAAANAQVKEQTDGAERLTMYRRGVAVATQKEQMGRDLYFYRALSEADRGRPQSEPGRDGDAASASVARLSSGSEGEKLAEEMITAPYPLRARRAAPLPEAASRSGGVGGEGGAEPAAATSWNASKSIRLRYSQAAPKVPPNESSGDDDKLRVLFVISPDRTATPSVRTENPAK